MLPSIVREESNDANGSAERYRRLVEEWKRRYANAKLKADTIRAQSQRRSNNDLAMELEATPRDNYWCREKTRKPSPSPHSQTTQKRRPRPKVQGLSSIFERAKDGTYGRDENDANKVADASTSFTTAHSSKHENTTNTKNQCQKKLPSMVNFATLLADRLEALVEDANKRNLKSSCRPSPSVEDLSKRTKHTPSLKKSSDRNNKIFQATKATPHGVETRNVKNKKQSIPSKRAANLMDDSMASTKNEIHSCESVQTTSHAQRPQAYKVLSRTRGVRSSNNQTAFYDPESSCDVKMSNSHSLDGHARKASNETESNQNAQQVDPSTFSKVERFFYDEEMRLRKKKERERKRQLRKELRQSGTEETRENTKKVWLQMQNDVDRRWAAYGDNTRPEGNNNTDSRTEHDGVGGEDRNTSSHSSYSHINTIAQKYARMSARELKAILRMLGVPDAEIRLVKEKIELVTLLQQAAKQKEERERVERREKEEVEKQDSVRKQLCAEIDRWKRNRSIRWLLNSINNASSTSSLYLPPYASFSSVSKVYKRSLLKIHPDKHSHCPFIERVRAEETFKAVSEVFTQFRKLHGVR